MNNSDIILICTKHFCTKVASHVVDLTKADNFSYSAIMREINKCCSDEQIKMFLSLYKDCFEYAIENKLQKPEIVALQNALIEFNKEHKIKISPELVKSASITELGSPEDIGSYIANVIHFLMNKISFEKRNKAILNLKTKLSKMDANSLANKNMPNSAAIGQSITFVKNILFNHDPHFIKEVLKHVMNKL